MKNQRSGEPITVEQFFKYIEEDAPKEIFSERKEHHLYLSTAGIVAMHGSAEDIIALFGFFMHHACKEIAEGSFIHAMALAEQVKTSIEVGTGMFLKELAEGKPFDEYREPDDALQYYKTAEKLGEELSGFMDIDKSELN